MASRSAEAQIKELKIAVYDLIGQKEWCERQMVEANQKIAQLMGNAPPPKPPEKKKVEEALNRAAKRRNKKAAKGVPRKKVVSKKKVAKK